MSSRQRPTRNVSACLALAGLRLIPPGSLLLFHDPFSSMAPQILLLVCIRQHLTFKVSLLIQVADEDIFLNQDLSYSNCYNNKNLEVILYKVFILPFSIRHYIFSTFPILLNMYQYSISSHRCTVIHFTILLLGILCFGEIYKAEMISSRW